MAYGLGGGIVEGLKVGAGLANEQLDRERQSRLDQRAQEQRTFENDLQTRAAGHVQTEEDRQALGDSLIATNGLMSNELNAVTALHTRARQENPDIDDSKLEGLLTTDPRYASEANTHHAEINRLYAARNNIYAHQGGKFALNYLDKAKATANDWHQGVSIADTPPEDTAKVFAASLNVPPSDLIRGDKGNSPSPAEQDMDETISHLEKHEIAEALQSGGQFLSPKYQQDLGRISHTGHEVTGSEPAVMLPHPDDPNHVTIANKLTLQRPTDGDQKTAYEPVKNPDGTVANISVENLLDDLYKKRAMIQAAGHPDVQDALTKAAAAGADKDHYTFSSMVAAAGGDVSKLRRKLESKELDMGDRYVQVITDPTTGKATFKENPSLKKGVRPGYGMAGSASAIQDMIDSGKISQEEGDALMSRVGSRGGRVEGTGLNEEVGDAESAVLSRVGMTAGPSKGYFYDATRKLVGPNDPKSAAVQQAIDAVKAHKKPTMGDVEKATTGLMPKPATAAPPDAQPGAQELMQAGGVGGKRVVRTGTDAQGRRVAQYSDGTIGPVQ